MQAKLARAGSGLPEAAKDFPALSDKSAMSDFSQTLKDLPWSGLIPVSLIVIMGLLLWAAGRRVFRAGFAIVGLIVGSCVGLVVGESLGVGFPSWILALIAGVVLACIAALMYRLAVAGLMMMIFAIAAPMGVITSLELQARRAGVPLKQGEVRNPAVDPFAEWLGEPEHSEPRDAASAATQSVGDSFNRGLERAKDALGEQAREGLGVLQEYGRRLVEALKTEWNRVPEKARPTLILSLVVGGVVGLLLGAIAPTFSAALVTALGGSLLWLTGARVLAVRFGVPEGPWLPRSGLAWMSVWLITTLLGLIIQWTTKQRPADKPDRRENQRQ